MREPLHENLQKIVDEQAKASEVREVLPFEKKGKKKEKTS
jgi:YidC/Oxa1 family membrane protein insertase